MPKTHTLRDEWFQDALDGSDGLREAFKQAGYPIDADVLRISTGFPSKGASRGMNGQNIGQCWDRLQISDSITQIYVSPVLVDPVRVLGTLVHELEHVVVGCREGHGSKFRKSAIALGLTGKMTCTEETPELVERLNALSNRVGPYPHAALDPTIGKKQSTRMIKAACGPCAYTVRLSRKQIEQLGCPICPGCEVTMEESV